MKLERRVVNKDTGLVQITTQDERWYFDGDKYLPSVTWICQVGVPKGIGYAKWLASKGWDEAEALKTEAGERGSIVHSAIEQLLKTGSVKFDDELMNGGGVARELTADEYEAVLSFKSWVDSLPSFTLKNAEVAIFDSKLGYAGTIDIVCEIDGKDWIIDIKTSADVYSSHRAQVSAYAKSQGIANAAILQVGYRRNKAKWKLTEVDVESGYKLFEAAKAFWEDEVGDTSPLQRELPLEIKLVKNN